MAAAAAVALRGGGRGVTREVLLLEARGLCTKPVGTGTAPPKKSVMGSRPVISACHLSVNRQHSGNDADVPSIRKNTSGNDIPVTDTDVVFLGQSDADVVAPQGSTKLLARKTPVEFRKMLSSSSLLLSADKGESISSTSLKEAAKPAEDTRMSMSRKTVVAFPQRGVVSSHEEENLTTPARGGGFRKELVEEQTSSSSESDSSSDSEDENIDDSEIPIKTKVEFPRRDPIFSENIAVKASMLAKEKLSQKSLKECGIKKLPRKPEINVSPVKQIKFSKTSVSQETSKSKARDPKVKSTPKEQKSVLEPHVVKSLDPTNVTRKSDHVEKKAIGTQVAAVQLKASAATQEDKKQKLISRGEKEKVKEAQELEAKEVTAPKVEETSGSTVVVMGTTAKEETTQEAGVQAGESSTIEETTAPAQEEFDNSTYKNLQHHEYHTYTFHDYITVLSKYRQPQPSSGRPSPRH